MNLGTLDQKEQICIACASCVSMNVCVLSRSLQVSLFSPPSEKEWATMGEFVSPTWFHELLSNLHHPGCSYLVEQMLTWALGAGSQEVFLSEPKCRWWGGSSFLSPDECALTMCRECRTAVLGLGMMVRSFEPWNGRGCNEKSQCFQQDQRCSLPLKNSYGLIEC